MAAFNINFASISKDAALQRARNYRGAKDGLQYSIAWAVGQAMNGNADGLFMVMREADLLAKDGSSKMTTYADGRAIWAYITAKQDQGGCGLSGIIRWDSDAQRFKMGEKWKGRAQAVDVVKLIETLSSTRWDTFKKVSADKAFDLDKAISALITRAANEGISDREIKAKFLALATAA